MKKAVTLIVATVFSSPLYSESESSAPFWGDLNGMWSVNIGAGKAFSNSGAKEATAVHPNGCENGSLVCNIEDSDTTFHISVERSLNNYLSMGVRYERLGDVYDLYSPTSDEKLKQSTSVISVNLLANYDTSTSFSPFAEIGAGYYKSKAEYSSPTLQLSDSSEGVTALFGLGVTYKHDSNWGGRIGWRRYNKIGERQEMLSGASDINTLSAKVDSAYISMLYTF